MNQTTNALERNKAIRAYLETGKTETCYPAWGGSVVRESQEGAEEVREALVEPLAKSGEGARSNTHTHWSIVKLQPA